MESKIIQEQELRPCVIEYSGYEKSCLFHKWVTNEAGKTRAIVEIADGKNDGEMAEVSIELIRFTDGKSEKYFPKKCEHKEIETADNIVHHFEDKIKCI